MSMQEVSRPRGGKPDWRRPWTHLDRQEAEFVNECVIAEQLVEVVTWEVMVVIQVVVVAR